MYSIIQLIAKITLLVGFYLTIIYNIIIDFRSKIKLQYKTSIIEYYIIF